MTTNMLFLCIIVSLPILLSAEPTHELVNSQGYSAFERELRQDELKTSISDREYVVYFGPEVCTLAQDLLVLQDHIIANNCAYEHIARLCNDSAQGKKTAPIHVIKAALYEAAEYLGTREPTQDLVQVASNLEAYLKKL